VCTVTSCSLPDCRVERVGHQNKPRNLKVQYVVIVKRAAIWLSCLDKPSLQPAPDYKLTCSESIVMVDASYSPATHFFQVIGYFCTSDHVLTPPLSHSCHSKSSDCLHPTHFCIREESQVLSCLTLNSVFLSTLCQAPLA
jgi:hypothetical protein